MTSTDTQHTTKPLKIGLLNDSAVISYYVKDIIDWSKTQPTIHISHYIIHSNIVLPKKSSFLPIRLLQSLIRNGMRKSCANLLFLLIQAIEHHFIKKLSRYKNHLAVYNAHESGLSLLKTSPIVSKSKHIHQFNDQDIDMIRACNFDVLIRCGGPILHGKILTAAKYGIISLHHGDNDEYRGGPPGFWEIYENNPLTGFIIQQLEAQLDNGVILRKGRLNTKPYWLLNQAHLYTQANYYFKLFLEELSLSNKLPESLPKQPYSQRLYKKPNIRECLRYIKHPIAHYLHQYRRTGTWHVSFIRHDWKTAILWQGVELPQPPGFELADPFLYRKDGKDYCFVEEINSTNNIGRIAVYEIGETHAIRLGTALQEPFHLSFPFLFEYDGTLFMMPESSDNKDIRLYECTEFPLQWHLKHILMNNISAADSFLTQQHERWWLFTNLDPANSGEHFTQLSIFSAETPLSDTWIPHPNNPIYIDATRARNGGFFQLENTPYRVSQNHNINIYGESVYINEIITLNHQHFSEQPIFHLFPRFKNNIQATHHFHTTGSLSVFDYYEL